MIEDRWERDQSKYRIYCLYEDILQFIVLYYHTIHLTEVITK